MPVGELLKYLQSPQSSSAVVQEQSERQEDPLKSLEGKLDTLVMEVLRRSRYEFKEDRLVFYIREKDLTEQDMQRIRSINPRIDFVVEKAQEESGLPPFVEKVKDMFGAKIISHEQRGKSKGASGKGS